MPASAMLSVRDFGAAGNGRNDDSEAIAAALAACARRGGTVTFPPGIYATGPLRLASNIVLHLSDGATIRFSDRFSDYPSVPTRWEGVECYGFSPLVYGCGLENVSIEGGGTLDGQGAAWWRELTDRRAAGRTAPETKLEKALARLNPGYQESGSGGGGREMQFLRPPLVQFFHCRNVRLRGITCQDSPFWTVHLVYCDQGEIEGVFFHNPPEAPNTDGLAIDSCRDIRVNDCVFDVGDDCISLKAGIDEQGRKIARPCESIAISGCTMRRGHGGVVLGSDTAGGIRNVLVSGCRFDGTDRGIRLKSRRGRGGCIEELRVNDILMTGGLCPLVINSYYSCGSRPDEAELFAEDARPATDATPRVREISLSKIVARGVRAAAGFICGLPESPVEDLELSDITIELSPGAPETLRDAAMTRGIDPGGGKELYGKHIRRARFSGLRICGAGSEPLRLEDCEDVVVI
jgi:polygalacturonase